MNVLVTGAAGFIGFNACRRLAASRQCSVLGVDNLNDYYSVDLKRARLAELESAQDFRFAQVDLADAEALNGGFAHFKPDYVVHLGAQAGVRYSTVNPAAYVRSNVDGFLNVLEACRSRPPKHLVFASSSSVYGASARVPFSEDQPTDRPVSFYGATKKSNELMAHSYAHLYGLNITGLRFFTVYGPWGRPDMTPVMFAKAICDGTPLKLFNEGRNLRDFTYVDDVIDGLLKVLLYPRNETEIAAEIAAGETLAPYRIYNIGHNRPVEMRLFVSMLEEILGRKAVIELLPPQPGDMVESCASLDRIHAAYRYAPKVTLEEGLRRFVGWFKPYYGYAAQPNKIKETG